MVMKTQIIIIASPIDSVVMVKQNSVIVVTIKLLDLVKVIKQLKGFRTVNLVDFKLALVLWKVLVIFKG